MTQSPSYPFHNAEECERLERQTELRGIERNLRYFDVPARGRVLDAGCGSGAMTRLIASRHPDSEVVGVDLNPGYVAWARDRATIGGINNLSFQVADVQRLLFEDASFDIIWSEHVLWYVPDPEIAVREFRRVIRPGGTLLVALNDSPLITNLPEDRQLQERLESIMDSMFLNPTIARKLPLMLRETGFDDISVAFEKDRVVTAFGRIGEAQRQNLVHALSAAMPGIAGVLGSRSEGEGFVSALLDYLDRSDTCSYSTYWIVKGTAPAV
jgi:ubiquinone/menaquinone biosynthesis C-methylase UbiE